MYIQFNGSTRDVRRLWINAIAIVLLASSLPVVTLWWLIRPAQWIPTIEQAVALQVYSGPHGLDANWLLTTEIMDKVVRTQAELGAVRENVREITSAQRENVFKIKRIEERLDQRARRP